VNYDYFLQVCKITNLLFTKYESFGYLLFSFVMWQTKSYRNFRNQCREAQKGIGRSTIIPVTDVDCEVNRRQRVDRDVNALDAKVPTNVRTAVVLEEVVQSPCASDSRTARYPYLAGFCFNLP
jgi:hypothetical protein